MKLTRVLSLLLLLLAAVWAAQLAPAQSALARAPLGPDGDLPLLLVDDDDGSPDVRPSYETALTNLGIAYTVWDTNGADDEPLLADLLAYDIVIWFTGDRFDGQTGPSAASEAALAAYLEAGDVAAGDGNCLLMTSQDYLYARGGNGNDILTPFMTDYLGAADGQSDVTQTSFTGTRPIFKNFTFVPPGVYSNWTDSLEPDATAAVMHVGDAGNASIYKTTAAYATTWWGMGFEALASADDAEILLGRLVNWCDIYTTTGVDVFAQE